MNRINLYVFSQIIKSCILVFFIFVSITWILQMTRLFTVMSHLQINSLDILLLSLMMIPNLINVTLPFLMIFGFVLSFIKMSKDKEIFAIYSSGLSINEIKKPVILIISTTIFLSLFINFIFSPYTYDLYKKKEFNLRNSINFQEIDFSNFIKFNKNLIIDFENENGEFKNILINITNENEVLMYSKKGEINQNNNQISFKLINGFKTEIKENSIENLKFDTYLVDFPINEKNIYTKIDPNTLSLFELLTKAIPDESANITTDMANEENKNNRIIIYQRLIDSLIIVSLCIFFYINIIKKNNYNLINQLFFIVVSILCLLIDNLFEAYTFKNQSFIIILFINVFIIHFFPSIFKILKIRNEI